MASLGARRVSFHLRRVWRAARGIVHEMNYGTERMTKRQVPWR
jgi:hypothetical protein